MKIDFIRHGKTAANQQHLYCGSTDIPLSAAGREELNALCYEPGDGIYITSGMQRTNETLRCLFGDVPYREDTDFREIDFGIFEMKSYEQLKDDPCYQDWIRGDNNAKAPPGGESGEAMQKRVLAAFSRLQDNSIVITHGGVIAAIMANLYPQEGKNRYQWQPEPGHGYRITQEGYHSIP